MRHAAASAVHGHAMQPDEIEATDEAGMGRAKGQAVPDDNPLDGHESKGVKAVHERRQHVLALHHAAVKQREGGSHEHDHGG